MHAVDDDNVGREVAPIKLFHLMPQGKFRQSKTVQLLLELKEDDIGFKHLGKSQTMTAGTAKHQAR